MEKKNNNRHSREKPALKDCLRENPAETSVSCHSDRSGGIPLDQFTWNNTKRNYRTFLLALGALFSNVPLKGILRLRSVWQKVGFTLVELIVVITILAILGTIGFVQMNGFASSARDSRRVSDMSNIQKAIDIAIVTQGVAPVPSLSTVYTGGTVNVQVGKADSSSIPKMSGDFSDPLTQEAYNYSVFGNGLYYQLGIDFENPLSYTIGIPGIETVYAADTSLKYSKLGGNYKFDPSLPSLFPIASTINTSSGGIFSPDVCFVMENVSTNTFGSSSGSCVKKKEMSLKENDSSLVGYWDMETLTGAMLKDLSGNGNDLNWITNVSNTNLSNWNLSNSFTWWIIWKSLIFSGTWVNWTDFTMNYLSWSKINLSKQSYTLSTIIKPDLPLNTLLHAIVSINDPFFTFLRIANFRTNYMIRVSPDTVYWSTLDWKINLQNNYFYKIDCVFDGSNQYTYINWKLDNSMKILGTSITSNTWWTITIWASTWINDMYTWIIDDIKLYNRALSDSEIKQQAKIAGF